LYPESGFGIADLTSYYHAIAPVLLPHLRGRPISFRRFPDDIHGESYWEKDAPAFTPGWVKTVAVPRARGESNIHYIVIEDERTLAWAASVRCIEIHPFLHCYADTSRPTSIVFDLDPGEGAGLIQCCRAALLIKQFFEQFELKVLAKVSGGKGMQVYLPLNTPITYPATQAFAKKVAEKLAAEHPTLIVAENTKSVRKQRVLIDWAQNSSYKSNVAVYSLRASGELPIVSVPLTWEETKGTVDPHDALRLKFGPEAALSRVREMGDLFGPVLTSQQKLPEKLLREWKIISGAPNVIAITQSRGTSKPARDRSSSQGGRRVFVVHSPIASSSNLELGLDFGQEFRCWRLNRFEQCSGIPIPATESNQREHTYFSDPHRRICDKGTYEVIEGSYVKGHLRLYFSGKRLLGEWTLSKKNGQWAFKTEQSVATHNAAEPSIMTLQDRSQMIVQPQVASGMPHAKQPDSLPEGQPRFIEAMEADEVGRPEELPSNRAEWLYEIKWDGYRAIAVKNDGKVRIYGRSGKPLENCRHEHLDEALAQSKFGNGVLDGEVVAFQNGIASFQTLQNSLRNNAPVVFVVFDILNYAQRDLTGLTYTKRREFLSSVHPLLPSLFPVSESIDADVVELLHTFKEKKIEGVVAKRRDSLYRAGKTSHGWVKYWIGELGRFVIGGYMRGKDRYFEALAVGEYANGELTYREQIRHGFSIAKKQTILAAIEGSEIPECPFENLPQKRRRGAVDEIRMEQYVWVQPKLHCLMRYKERTAAGEIREHGKFVRLIEKEAA